MLARVSHRQMLGFVCSDCHPLAVKEVFALLVLGSNTPANEMNPFQRALALCLRKEDKRTERSVGANCKQDLATLEGGILEFFARHTPVFLQVDKERNTGDGDEAGYQAGAQTEEIKGVDKTFCCYLRHTPPSPYIPLHALYSTYCLY
jgi:hypothetical protein